MKNHPRLLSRVVASLLALAGMLSCLAGPGFPVGAQDSRVLQVWPDRSVGVASGMPEGATGYAFTQVFPFGVSRTSSGDVVQGRAYLHFPLDVFPPGTEIVQATLHVYVDTASREGEATFGAYRVLDPWGEDGWRSDPDTWPALFAPPAATTLIHLDVVTPTTPAFVPLPIATPAPISQPTATPTPSTLTVTPTIAPSQTPSPIPTLTVTATLTATSTPTATPTLTVTTTPTDTLSYQLQNPKLGSRAITSRRRVLLRPLRSRNLDEATPPTSPLSTPTEIPPTSTPVPTPMETPPTATPVSTPVSPPPSSLPVVTLDQVAETWLTWDVTALMQDYLSGDAADYGLALASAPDPNADPEAASDLLVARWLDTRDPETIPYLIVEIKVHPVTATPAPVLPSAGGAAGWRTGGLLLVGAALLVLGLTARRR